MKWFCKISHRWSYSVIKRNIKNGIITVNRRRCLRCNKVECQSLLNGLWWESSLTKEEKRDINLKNLGL